MAVTNVSDHIEVEEEFLPQTFFEKLMSTKQIKMKKITNVRKNREFRLSTPGLVWSEIDCGCWKCGFLCCEPFEIVF